MTDAPAPPVAIREFADRVEQLADILMAVISKAAGDLDAAADCLRPHPLNEDFAIIDRADLLFSLIRLEGQIKDEIEEAVKDFVWELSRARAQPEESARRRAFCPIAIEDPWRREAIHVAGNPALAPAIERR